MASNKRRLSPLSMKPLWGVSEEPPPLRDGFVGRLQAFFVRDVWRRELRELPWYRRTPYRLARILYLTANGFVQDKCMFRASALTYITVLSLVPLLAFAFSAAKGFGALDRLKEDVIVPFIDDNFSAPTVEEPTAEEVAAASEEPEEGGDEAASPEEEGTEEEPSAAEAEDEGTQDTAAAATTDADPRAGAEPGGGAPVTATREEESTSGLRVALYQVLAFVEQTDFARLGAIGLLFLLYTVIKLLGTIERSFNEIWGVTRSRTFTRKVADYLSMVLIAPMLALASTFVTSATENSELLTAVSDKLHLGPAIVFLSRFTSVFTMLLAFGFVYMALPNTKTRISSSAVGALLAALLWFGLQLAMVRFQVGIARYNAIYSGFAAIPIFLVWLYASWVIVLLGAELAHAHQAEPDYRAVALGRSRDPAFRERVGLRTLVRIAANFLKGAEPQSGLQLAQELGASSRLVHEQLEHLLDAGLITLTEGEKGECYVLAKDPERITVKEALDALRGDPFAADLIQRDEVDERVDRLMDGLDGDLEHSSHNRTLKDLAHTTQEAARPQPTAATERDLPAT